MRNKVKYDADLHCHTTASDGLLSPYEVVKLAKSKGLQALAITDHDTINGLEEAQKAADQFGVLLVKGVEINTDWEGKDVHILGYEMEIDSPSLRTKLHELREKRVSRIQRILMKLEALELEISFDQVLEYVHGDSVGRPHVAQAMVKQGYAATVREAFDKYLKRGMPAYVPRYNLNPVQAIRIIQESGGVAVLAHPGSQSLENKIPLWVESGLQGIEVSHPDHSLDYRIRYGVLAERMNLLATGGSDFHGRGIKPGIELGDWGVEMDTVYKLIERAVR